MNNSINTKSLTVWRFIDGKVGHEKQSQALIEGLKKNIHVNLFDIPTKNSQFTYWMQWLFNKGLSINGADKPDIVIGAGHSTHVALLATKRYFKCKALVIMKPSLPFWLFDYIVAPEHDFLKGKKPSNLISTLTALAPYINSQPNKDEGLILLGGISKHFEWNDQAISEQIKEVITSLPQTIHWNTSTSRRTPPLTLPTLRTTVEDIDNITLLDHEQLSKCWLETQLKTSGHIIITTDSVSMIAEALNTKADIYIIKLASKKIGNKIESTLSLLNSNNILKINNQNYTSIKNRSPLNQQDKCAEIIIEKYFQHEL